MQCSDCGHDYAATNQYSKCPSCGAIVGTTSEADLRDKLALVNRWFDEWSTGTAEALVLARRDLDYYHGKQWAPEEEAEVKARGQAPIVKNRIFKKINMLRGMEVRNRSDPKALPRNPQHDDDANAATDGLRFVCDEQEFDAKSSAVWFDELVPGWGGAVIETEIVESTKPLAAQSSVTPQPNGAEVASVEVDQVVRTPEIRIRQVSWDRLWWDVHSRKPDFSDASHKGITTWMDAEDAVAMYANRDDVTDNFEDVIRTAVADAADSNEHRDKPASAGDGKRDRVQVRECYYREPDPETHKLVWYNCHFTKSGFVVAPKPTGFVDEDGNDVCPLEMTSGFVDADGMRYGLVRNMISPQDEINKHSQKGIYQGSVRQFAYEDGVFPNPDEAALEMAKPDGKIRVHRGALADRRFQILPTGDMQQTQVAMLQEAKAEIDMIGPEMPQLGNMPASASGRARQLAMQVGSLELAPIEDNHKRWKLACDRQVWWRIKQFKTEEWWMRVQDEAERTGFRFVALNRQTKRADRFLELIQKDVPVESALRSVLQPLDAQKVMQQAVQAHQVQMQAMGPDAPQMPPEQMQQVMAQFIASHPKMREMFTANDVAHLDVDIVLEETPDTTILQQEEYETLTQQIPMFLQPPVLQSHPELPSVLLEMLIEASQLRSKKKLLALLRKPTDPKAAQMAQMQQQLGMATQKAGLDVAQSQAALNKAKAQHEAIKAQTEPAKAQADILQSQGQAMVHAANAGEKAGAPLGVIPRTPGGI